jgi:hypothetical protein
MAKKTTSETVDIKIDELFGIVDAETAKLLKLSSTDNAPLEREHKDALIGYLGVLLNSKKSFREDRKVALAEDAKEADFKSEQEAVDYLKTAAGELGYSLVKKK